MIDAIDRAAGAWWGWIAPVSVQAAILLLAVALIDRLLRRRAPAQVRAALWLAALARLVLPADLASPASLTAPIAAALPGAAGATGATGAAGTGAGFAAILLLLWAAGAAAALLRGLRADRAERRRLLDPAAAVEAPAAALRALARAARRAGLRRAPTLVVSSAADGACVVGLLRPVVVLPAGEADLDAVLLHECAHLRRGDPWARAAVRLLAAAFWFHPLVLFAARRVEALREACCDATVARILGPGTPAYRDALVRAAERLVGRPRRAAAALGVLGRGDGLADRLLALEGTPWRGARARAAGSLAAAAFVLGCLAPMAAPPAADDRGLAEARALLDSAAAGRRESCWQVRFAAIRVAQEEGLLPGPGRVPSSGEVGP